MSKLPPETLGEIFRWNTIRESDFGSLRKRSHNFLLVCHHWFKIASCAPELWGFWGNNLQDWKKRYLRHPSTPLDLVLYAKDVELETLDDNLRNVLKDRIARDTIRRIHLAAEDTELLNSIISSLANYEGIRSRSVESVVVEYEDPDESPIVSNFLACYRFPKLQRLVLSGCTIPSWNRIVLNTSVLTTLSLDIDLPSPKITSSQILSILRSSPSLREVVLRGCAVPDDGGDRSSLVPLTHLRELAVAGRSQDVFALLHQLNYPGNMDRLFLDLGDIAPGNISRIVGPYLRDYFRRCGRSHGGLGLDLSYKDEMEFRVEDAGKYEFSDPGPAQRGAFVRISIQPDQMPPQGLLEEDLHGLIASVPQEEVAYIRADSNFISMQVISDQLPYLRATQVERTPLPVAFPEPIFNRPKIFPRLQHIRLYLGRVRPGDWGLLATFLDHLASSGNRLDKLELEADCSSRMSREVEERIKGAVREFRVLYVDYF